MFQTQFVYYSGLSVPYLSIEASRTRQRASQAAAIKQALSASTIEVINKLPTKIIIIIMIRRMLLLGGKAINTLAKALLNINRADPKNTIHYY